MLRSLAIALLLVGPIPAEAGSEVLPSDIAVTFTATPSDRLLANQPIELTLSVTNNGPVAIDRLSVQSAPITGPLELLVGAGCLGMVGSVVDLEDSSYFLLTWYFFPDPYAQPELAVGETRTCHLRGMLSPSAPPVTTFAFGLSRYWSDPNPANDTGSITLGRVSTAAPASSAFALFVLCLLLVAAARSCRRQLRAR